MDLKTPVAGTRPTSGPPGKLVARGRAIRLPAFALPAVWLALAGLSVPAQPAWGQADGLPAGQPPLIAEIRFVGNRIYTDEELRDDITTLAGRPYDEQNVEQDVRKMLTSGKFFDINVRTTPGARPGTLIVIFEVVEYPKVRYVRFVGNDHINDRALRRHVGISPDDPADVATVRRAKERLEAFYRGRGFARVDIEIREGLSRNDAGIVFVIQEGPLQKIWSVNFVGNTIESDARLMTYIESKPPLGKYILRGWKGFADRKTIDEDIDRLTAFYRSLGFFDAKIGREIQYDETGEWARLTFVIHEGPRYRIRDISFAGNRIYRDDQLAPLLKLDSSQFYDQRKMDEDVNSLTDAYGSRGYIFADIKASPRYLEPGVMDLVYEIDEGDRYRVGRITVNIVGETAHTQHTTVLNRISLRPGDVVDIREVRASERRIQASSLFNADPTQGPRPRITFNKRDTYDDVRGLAEDRGSAVRGQSPAEAEPRSGDVHLWIYPENGTGRHAAVGDGTEAARYRQADLQQWTPHPPPARESRMLPPARLPDDTDRRVP